MKRSWMCSIELGSVQRTPLISVSKTNQTLKGSQFWAMCNTWQSLIKKSGYNNYTIKQVFVCLWKPIFVRNFVPIHWKIIVTRAWKLPKSEFSCTPLNLITSGCSMTTLTSGMQNKICWKSVNDCRCNYLTTNLFTYINQQKNWLESLVQLHWLYKKLYKSFLYCRWIYISRWNRNNIHIWRSVLYCSFWQHHKNSDTKRSLLAQCVKKCHHLLYPHILPRNAKQYNVFLCMFVSVCVCCMLVMFGNCCRGRIVFFPCSPGWCSCATPYDHFVGINTAHIPDPMPQRCVYTAQLKSLTMHC